MMSCNCPVAVSAPANTWALMMSQIVGIMPAMPRVETSLSSASTPVEMWVLS